MQTDHDKNQSGTQRNKQTDTQVMNLPILVTQSGGHLRQDHVVNSALLERVRLMGTQVLAFEGPRPLGPGVLDRVSSNKDLIVVCLLRTAKVMTLQANRNIEEHANTWEGETGGHLWSLQEAFRGVGVRGLPDVNFSKVIREHVFQRGH